MEIETEVYVRYPPSSTEGGVLAHQDKTSLEKSQKWLQASQNAGSLSRDDSKHKLPGCDSGGEIGRMMRVEDVGRIIHHHNNN